MHDTLDLFRFLHAHHGLGEMCALITVTDIIMPTSRNVGAMMVVSESGAYLGSLSGGCIEAALVTEAQQAIIAQMPRTVCYGVGSPFIDIRLPCGGGIKVLISPIIDGRLSAAVLTRLSARQAVRLCLPISGEPRVIDSKAVGFAAGFHGGVFMVDLPPPLKIDILGHGAYVEALYQLTQAFGTEVEIYTPDAAIEARLARNGARTHLLRTPNDVSGLRVDPWTASIFLFHDHDWEPLLLQAAVVQGAFYVGAMGSQRAAKLRNAAMMAVGIGDAVITKIHTPIGLIPRTRDVKTLALSVLSEVVEAYNQAFLERLPSK